MPSQVTNYKCPACTGPLHFVGATGKLQCDYCGSTYTVEEIEALMARQEAEAQASFHTAEEKEQQSQQQAAEEGWDYSSLSSDWGSDAGKLRSYSCPSCGAELICDETTAATSCPYCGNPAIVPGQFAGELKPDLIIPFQLDKEAAVAALKNHYRGKVFLPRTFTDANHIQEIKGVYVPFWLFDGVADADMEFEATRSFTRRQGDYNVTTTEHFRVHRAGSVPFSRVPVDASSKMPDDYMDSIEPYDYSALKPFSTAYLPGYLADKYDVSVKDSAARVDERCENSAAEALRSTVQGYATCIPLRQDVRLRRGKVRYALMPVWLLNTKWNGKDFLFAMNGQTGKLVGDLPVSRGRFWGTFAAIAAPAAAVIAAVLYLL